MTEAEVLALIAGVVSLLGIGLGGYINYRISNIHKQINSRMDQLLEITRSSSKAEGKEEQRIEQKKSL
jgi:hypothetical protein